VDNISWKLAVEFDKQNQLFFKKIETNYKITTFVCSCGTTKFIVSPKYQDIDYICQECENDKFLDANDANLSIQNLLNKYSTTKEYKKDYWTPIEYITTLDIDFDFKTQVIYKDKNTIAQYFIKVPCEIDFVSEKVFYKDIALAEYILYGNGTLNWDYSFSVSKDIFEMLNKLLDNYITNNDTLYDIPPYSNRKLNTATASFFLKYKNFKEYEFYHWVNPKRFDIKDITIADALKMTSINRKEKSIKKAIYQNYIYQVQNNNKFYHALISIFCKHIKDPNILVKFIDLDIAILDFMPVDLQHIEDLIIFLQEHYKDKQILDLFVTITTKKDEQYFIDLLNEFSVLEDKNIFEKVKCNITTLHDEFVRCAYFYRQSAIANAELSYTQKEIDNCKDILNYEVKLPLKGIALLDWGKVLHNCIGGYFKLVNENKTIIYGFYYEGEINFAVEIREGKIVQASQKYNKALNNYQNKALNIWHRSCFDVYKY
jgi:hypothetical protein